jgi:uncharacterized membrane protein
MSRYGTWGLGLVALALAAHFAVVWTVPRAIMFVAMRQIAAQAGMNREGHAPIPTEKSRTVVMPSPDLAYTVCVFDVSGGPLELKAKVPPTYWSLSLYAANSDNFFVVNDSQAPPGGTVRIVLASEPSQVRAETGTMVVGAKTVRGIVVFRTLLAPSASLTEISAVQKEMTCRPFMQ